MITNVWAELDPNELPFIDKEIGPEDFKILMRLFFRSKPALRIWKIRHHV